MPRPLAPATLPLVALLLALTACGADDEPGAPEPDRAFDTAVERLEALRVVEEVLPSRVEGNPAKTLLRPEARAEAAVVHDSRLACPTPGIECGAVLEVWNDADTASARSEHLRALLTGLGPPYDAERHLLDGRVLLRFAVGTLRPQQIDDYRVVVGGD